MRTLRCYRLYSLLVGAFVVAAGGSTPRRACADDWQRWATPEAAGFSSAAIAAAERHWLSLPDAPNAAFMLVFKGKILASFGSEARQFWSHSMRKSFLSALYGIHVEKGDIDLDETLAELGIDDRVPLTRAEMQATALHLLKARSGVYIEAACESQSMKAARPQRGSQAPDAIWYYNNWDFNALGTIFRQETGRDIFEEFRDRIGEPIGMQDFEPALCEYLHEPELSEHPCYTFRMSTRDRARFGQLFLQNGRWGERQIVPRRWVTDSTVAHSQTNQPGRGYGYMWWTYEPGFFRLFQDPSLEPLWGYAATGFGGQIIQVLPDADIVAVFSADVPAGAGLSLSETVPVLETILTGREIVDLRTVRAKAKPKRAGAGELLKLRAKLKNASGHRTLPTGVDFYLLRKRSLGDDAVWIGRAEVGGLAPGASKTVRMNVARPDDLEPGKYYVAALTDEDRTNYDLARPNNLEIGRKILVR